MATEYATFEERTGWTEEKHLHVGGTTVRSDRRIDFWMHVPRPEGFTVDEWDAIRRARWDKIDWSKGVSAPMRCGICKNDMTGHKHCPFCFPEKVEEA